MKKESTMHTNLDEIKKRMMETIGEKPRRVFASF